MTIAFLTGYFVFLPASAIGASGVLAVVTAGVYMGWHTPELTTVETRLQGEGFWAIFNFLLNALLFGLVGLQLQPILDQLHGYSWQELIGYAALVSAIVIAGPNRLRVPHRLHPALGLAGASRARSRASVAVRRLHRVGGDERRGHARRGARDPAEHGFGRRRFPTAR